MTQFDDEFNRGLKGVREVERDLLYIIAGCDESSGQAIENRLGQNRDRAVRDEKLTFYFRNMGANDQDFIDAFNDEFYRHQTRVEQTLPAASSVTGNKRNMIEAAYDIETDAYDEFFEDYVVALEQAFVEHVVENEQYAVASAQARRIVERDLSNSRGGLISYQY